METASPNTCSDTGDGGGLRMWVRKRPLLVFFVLSYGIAWIAFVPYAISPRGLGIIRIQVPFSCAVAGTFGPTIAALATHWIAERNPRLFHFSGSWRNDARGSLIGSFLICIAFVLLPIVILLKGPASALSWGAFGSIAANAWFAVLDGPLGEEPGWRGFALPRLQARFGALRGSLALGVLWSAWHLPLFLVRGWASGTFFGYTLMILGATILMTFGANLSGFSIIAAVAMHLAFNLSSELVNGLLANSEITNAFPPEAVFVFSSLAVSGFVVLVTRGRLGRMSTAPTMRRKPYGGQTITDPSK